MVTLGEAGTTTLAENVAALPPERYRVEKFLIADPADIDGDCIDDITELADPVGNMNPVNPAAAIEFSDGVVAVPGRDTFETLSWSTSLGESIVKFAVYSAPDTARPRAYFMNTKTYARTIGDFQQALTAVGHRAESQHRRPFQRLRSPYHPATPLPPMASSGVYVYMDLAQRYPFSRCMHRAYTVLAASIPLLEDNLAYHIRDSKGLQLFPATTYRSTRRIPNQPRVRHGRLLLKPTSCPVEPGVKGTVCCGSWTRTIRPHPRDIVIYEALPNELVPRRRHCLHRAADAAVARQPARRAGRRSQRLHPRCPRLATPSMR